MSKHTTIPAPANFVDLPPNLPPTIELSIQVGNIPKHLRLRKAGKSVAQYWTAVRHDAAGFQQLLAIIRAGESLWSLFGNEIGYEGGPKSLPVLSPCSLRLRQLRILPDIFTIRFGDTQAQLGFCSSSYFPLLISRLTKIHDLSCIGLHTRQPQYQRHP
jgi:hypothetical protein